MIDNIRNLQTIIDNSDPKYEKHEIILSLVEAFTIDKAIVNDKIREQARVDATYCIQNQIYGWVVEDVIKIINILYHDKDAAMRELFKLRDKLLK